MARMPKNQLLDLLFKLFGEKGTWPIKLLREKTQQPEAFLKETLSDIAFLHRSGEHNGTWELKENFKEGVRTSPKRSLEQEVEQLQAKPEAGPSGLPGMAGTEIKTEGAGEDDYDEEEDDDDMEEVS